MKATTPFVIRRSPLHLSGRLFITALFLSICAQAANASVAALVTKLEGVVSRVTSTGKQPLQAFVKLKTGDQLTLEGNAIIQMVFFASKRQETWSGNGQLDITAQEAVGSGLAEPFVRVLPDVFVQQVAKTPTLDSQGRAGVVRLRVIPTPEAIAKLDETYKRLRQEAAADDLDPELYLLAGLLEMRLLERIGQVLADLETTYPSNAEAKALVALYKAALQSLHKPTPQQ